MTLRWLVSFAIVVTVMLCNHCALHAQTLSIAAEHTFTALTDIDGARGFAIALRPGEHFTIRYTRGNAESSRVDLTCGIIEPECAPEALRAEGLLQSMFLGWSMPVLARQSVSVRVTPEIGFARVDGTRFGKESGRVATARGDFIGVGVRGAVAVRPFRDIGLAVKFAGGLRGMIFPAPGESLGLRHDPYREPLRTGTVSLGVSYGLGGASRPD